MNNESTSTEKYDLVIIGAGSGGLAAAEFAAALGGKIALVEASDRLGGECLHAGCVPSKTLIHAARQFQAVREHLEPWDELRKDSFKKAMQEVKDSISHIEVEHDNNQYYENLGVTVINQKAHFTGKNSITLADGRNVIAKRFIIATGSKPVVPSISGLGDIKYLTNESIFDVQELPASLIVIGGGPIGCELGQAFAMFGCQVTIISNGDRLLPRDEPEASDALRASLEKYKNIELVFGAEIISAENKDGLTINFKLNDESQSRSAEHVLIATGRAANTDLGLSEAGVNYTDRQIETNDKLQTSNKNIYAIGDVMGGPNFTHVAVDQAVTAVQNALLGRSRAKRPIEELSWATFTTPEIAHLGADEASLISDKTNYEKHVLDYNSVDKAVAEHQEGLIKILTDKDGLILGATIVGGPAAEVIGTLALAKKQGMKLTQLGGALQAYPTYAFGLKFFANSVALEDFKQSWQKKLADLLRKFTLR